MSCLAISIDGCKPRSESTSPGQKGCDSAQGRPPRVSVHTGDGLLRGVMEVCARRRVQGSTAAKWRWQKWRPLQLVSPAVGLSTTLFLNTSQHSFIPHLSSHSTLTFITHAMESRVTLTLLSLPTKLQRMIIACLSKTTSRSASVYAKPCTTGSSMTSGTHSAAGGIPGDISTRLICS